LEAEMQECQRVREQLSAENRQLQTEMKRLKERLERLEEATEEANCPLCGQPLSPQHRLNLIDELTAEGRAMGDRYRENQQRIAAMEQDLKTKENRLEELARLDSELRQQQRSLAEKSTRLHLLETQWREWEENDVPRLAEIRRMLEEENFALEARAHLAQVEAELQAIGYDAEAHAAARRAEMQRRTAEEEFRQLEVARASLSALEREVATLQQEVDRQSSEVARLEDSYRQAAGEFAELQKKAPDIKEAETTLYRIREDENRKRIEVGQAEQKIKVLEEQKVRREQLLLEREYLGRRSGYYKQLELAFSHRGVPALIIEQALPQIEAKANQILERLSMGSMSVRFVTQVPYKEKRRQELREALDIEISDGLGLRAYEMYSGGEAFRVNFAIRLALAEVLAQRAGARLQTLVIDEGFGSQDDQGRQRLVEAINAVRKDFAKILVITHLDELKDHFPTRIEVEKSERGSTLRIV
jgi:exonuclease SbcC